MTSGPPGCCRPRPSWRRSTPSPATPCGRPSTCFVPRAWSNGCPASARSSSHRSTPTASTGCAASPRRSTGTAAVSNEVRALGPDHRPPQRSPARLRLDAGDDVLYIERLRRLDGLPLSLDLTYIPLDLGPRLLGCRPGEQRHLRALEEIAGQPLGHADLLLEAVSADPHSAAVLGTAARRRRS